MIGRSINCENNCLLQPCSVCTYDAVSGTHAAEWRWWYRMCWFFGGGAPLVVEGGQTVLAAEVLHGSFTVRSQNDVLRPKYQPERKRGDLSSAIVCFCSMNSDTIQFICSYIVIILPFLTENLHCLSMKWWRRSLLNSLLAVVAGLGVSFDCRQRCGEAFGGAEQCWGTLPLESSLPFPQVLIAVGAVHIHGGRIDDRQRLCFRSWVHWEDGSNLQILLLITHQWGRGQCLWIHQILSEGLA